ncbi:glycerol-3-phosphate dehydrogenase [Roseateles paludis]|uniref:Glycerol-3-phosphate dehydrogenase n=1 Tax=Roseateles paludis TaxID=3145238 RepID=A0ABV0FZ60_9BURK
MTAAAHPRLPELFDAFVVGGGINGVGVARDLAGRGLRVLLCEQHDLASHTSSASSKLIHGGLRYLEHYEFRLVAKALGEREVLLKSAPHLMRSLRFVMPHDERMRPAWMIRAGLFLYDHLAKREWLPGTERLKLRKHPTGAPLQARLTTGFAYSDGWVDDARLVVACAQDAVARGSRVLTRTACVDARRVGEHWQARLRDAAGQEQLVQARALVNAAGPWAAQFLAEHVKQGEPERRSLRLVKGSHIVVPQCFTHDHAYIFQNPDGRILFAIPYEGRFTLIGTTDVEHHGPIGHVRISDEEIAYLCTQASRYFATPVTPDQVLWTYAGVRPLLDDEHGNPAEVTRDYRLELDAPEAQAPLLNLWGGKLTTFRRLAEDAADLLAPRLGNTQGAWTRGALLPGGDLSAWIGAPRQPDADFERFVGALTTQHPEHPPALLRRWAHAYGSAIATLLAAPLGEEVAPGVYEGELAYLRDHEWARSGEDVLWRRSKLGLHLSEAERARVVAWVAGH